MVSMLLWKTLLNFSVPFFEKLIFAILSLPSLRFLLTSQNATILRKIFQECWPKEFTLFWETNFLFAHLLHNFSLY